MSGARLQALNEIDPLEAVLVKESDGSDWELGAGSLGKVLPL